MTFANPNILWMALLVVPMVAYYIWRARQGGAAIRISSTDSLRKAPRTVRYYLRHVPFVLRCVAVLLLVVALARPQSAEHNTRKDAEGIDIVLAIDISGSMLARDFKPDRLAAAKDVASSFISSRYGDRIGIVAFAGEAYTQSPLTTDQGSLQTLLARVRSGVIEDGTAIGNGLATAINRLRESDAKSKVVILLTDGVNNRGQIAPVTAAEIARDANIKVYTIGVGSNGEAPYPLFDDEGNVVQMAMMKVEIDEKSLRNIAETTGGTYFRATDKESLIEVYNRIDRMEKSRVEITEFTVMHEEYLLYVVAALLLLIAEIIINRLILKRIP
ncbi:MAG: VWA domain-containing protein [Alistipes sp.]|nr:VWA domain-containing protein [Alistipes sp.]